MSRLVPSSLLVLPMLALGCTAPDISTGITQSRAILDQTRTDLAPAFEVRIAADLRAAELAAAQRGEVLIALGECSIAFRNELSYDSRNCPVITYFDPLNDETRGNAAQVSEILRALADYYAALEVLSKTDSVDQLRLQSEGLVQAFEALADNPSTPLARFGKRSADVLGPFPALSTFIADQSRIRALRNAMDAADPVLNDFLSAAEGVLVELGDPLPAARSALLTAEAAYLEAARTRAPAARQVNLAQAVRDTNTDLEKAEGKSVIRRLYIIRETHAEMLALLNSGGSIADLDRLVDHLNTIKTALES